MDEDRKKSLKEELMAIFDTRFGHLDFWRLSKRWKQKVYAQEADCMINVIIQGEISYTLRGLDKLIASINEFPEDEYPNNIRTQVIELLQETVNRVDY